MMKRKDFEEAVQLEAEKKTVQNLLNEVSIHGVLCVELNSAIMGNGRVLKDTKTRGIAGSALVSYYRNRMSDINKKLEGLGVDPE